MLLGKLHNRRWARNIDTRFAEALTLPAPVGLIHMPDENRG